MKEIIMGTDQEYNVIPICRLGPTAKEEHEITSAIRYDVPLLCCRQIGDYDVATQVVIPYNGTLYNFKAAEPLDLFEIVDLKGKDLSHISNRIIDNYDYTIVDISQEMYLHIPPSLYEDGILPHDIAKMAKDIERFYARYYQQDRQDVSPTRC